MKAAAVTAPATRIENSAPPRRTSAGDTRLVEKNYPRRGPAAPAPLAEASSAPASGNATPQMLDNSLHAMTAAARAAPLPKDTSSAATAVLRSGVGASALTLHKTPAVRDAIRAACFDLACTARAHLSHARDQAPRVPSAAPAALLPAVTVGRFLDRLEAHNFDPFAGGLGPWVDDRVGAHSRLHLALLGNTLFNTY